MPGILLSVILIVGIAVGIAWPLIQRRRTVSVEIETGTSVPPVEQEHRRLEQICPHCSIMNASSRTVCRECGSTLPLESFSGLLGGTDKQETIRELTQAGFFLLGMIVVMFVSSWLPMPGKIAILVGTLSLLCFRFYKHVSGD